MDLAVIVLNWRHEAQTVRCAQAVMAWTRLRPHLIVVDNESTEASKRALSSNLEPGSLICSSANLGYGGGNNLAIKRALAAKAQYVLLLNADAEIAPDGVERLLERLNSNPQISVLSPMIREDGAAQMRVVGGRDIARHSLTRLLLPVDAIKQVPGYPIYEVNFVPGTAFLTRASVFEAIGLLDEEYFFSGEIADFCKRATLRGHRICVDLEVEARHEPGQTPPNLRETLYRYYGLRNRFLYIKKHHGGERRYVIYWSLIGIGALMRAALIGKTATAKAVLIALLDACWGRYGNRNAEFL